MPRFSTNLAVLVQKHLKLGVSRQPGIRRKNFPDIMEPRPGREAGPASRKCVRLPPPQSGGPRPDSPALSGSGSGGPRHLVVWFAAGVYTVRVRGEQQRARKDGATRG